MKKLVVRLQVVGFLFTGIMGVVLHFLFDLLGKSIFIAPFAAVNESIWEHMKILFFPMVAFAIWESHRMPDKKGDFWCIKVLGIIIGFILIPTLYYTLNGALGPMPDWVNIAIFFIVAAAVYAVETYLFQNSIISCAMIKDPRWILWGIALLFVAWTFLPPHLPLFKDPIMGIYGFLW